MSLIDTARALATQAHKDMFRPNKGRSPYSVHFEEVAALVAAHGGDAEEVAAGLLHDTVEDTDLTPATIAARTTSRVAELVDGLTDPPHFAALPLAERKALQAERLRAKGLGVKRVKVADQISNVRSVAVDPPVKWDAAKCMAYADGAKLIVDTVRGEHPELGALVALFDDAYAACAAAHAPSAVANLR